MDAKWLRNSFFYFIVLVFLIAFLVAFFPLRIRSRLTIRLL